MKTMSLLKFFDGARPGQKKKLSDDEKQQKAKEYEAKRVKRTFQNKWKSDRSWLQYDESQNKMLCDEDSDCGSDDGLDFQDEEGNTNRVMLFGCVSD
jgi:hypothetical protein